jgi:hypothetical protein
MVADGGEILQAATATREIRTIGRRLNGEKNEKRPEL